MAEVPMTETTGQRDAPPELLGETKSFKMRDGAVCGDIAEIDKPCAEVLVDAPARTEHVDTVDQGTSPESEHEDLTEEDDESCVESVESSIDDDCSDPAVDNYYSHKFIQDLLCGMVSGHRRRQSGHGEDSPKRELLDPTLVKEYVDHATRVYQVFLKHIFALECDVKGNLLDFREEASQLDLGRRIQVELYADTVELSIRQLRRVAMRWSSSLLLDDRKPERTVPEGYSEQYLFCKVVSACLKLRDSWWKNELYLSKYFLRLLDRIQGISYDWQTRLQEANVAVLRSSVEVHERMDREIALWQWARNVKFPEHRTTALQANLLNVFVDEQLTGDVSSLMTLFVFETGNTVFRAVFNIKKEFEHRQLSYDSSNLEAEVRDTWNTYLDNVYDQCSNLGTNRALYTMDLGEDPAQIGHGLRFYMDMVSPLHRAVTNEWSKTFEGIKEQLNKAVASKSDESQDKDDLLKIIAWVDQTGHQVLDTMQSAFIVFESQVQVATKNVEQFCVHIRKILE